MYSLTWEYKNVLLNLGVQKCTLYMINSYKCTPGVLQNQQYTGPYQKVTGTTSRVISECDISGLENGHLVALRGDTNNLLIYHTNGGGN